MTPARRRRTRQLARNYRAAVRATTQTTTPEEGKPVKYTVYAERRVSYAVEVEAPDPVEAERLGLDEMPGENLQDVDTAGDWEVLSITDEKGQEVPLP